MGLPMRMFAFLPVALVVAACAKEEDASPANVDIQVDFPSTAAAVAVDGVKFYVFDGAQSCNDLVRLRQTAQSLPKPIYESASLTPCQLQEGRGSVTIDRNTAYAMFAVGTAAGKDVLVGCTVQSGFGETVAQPVPLTYIDATQRIPTTSCTKLSDKCGGRCQ